MTVTVVACTCPRGQGFWKNHPAEWPVDSLTVGIGIHKEGVAFDSMDGSPSQIFIMTVSPTKRAGPHIQFLAEISRLISPPEERERLLAAQSNSEIYEILTGK